MLTVRVASLLLAASRWVIPALAAAIPCQVLAYATLAEAYAAMGFDPRAPGNAVVVFFSDPHMNMDPSAPPAPLVTTNLDWRLIEAVNAMDPPPAKVIVSGDVSSNMGMIPGHDATGDRLTYQWATNEMRYYHDSIKAFTNIAQTNIVWIPGNHDQGAFETNAEAFRMMFPEMPPYQAIDIAGMRFFLLNSGNYGQPGEAQAEWLRAQVSTMSKTQALAVVTHQRPFAGVVVHRGMALLLREVFGDWETPWWVLDGHEHAHSMEMYDIGRSGVAQLTIGPASTNTFVSYTYDCGFTVLCISNGIAGYIYHHYWDRSYRLGFEPNWAGPAHFAAAFEEVPGIVWRRLKSPAKSPELIEVDADDSMDWWAYPKLLEWELPLAVHGNEATHFLLLVSGLSASATVECSLDRENWTTMTASGVHNSVYRYPLPPEVAAAEKAYVRFTGTVGNNWVGGWGLGISSGEPTVTFPRLEPIPYQDIPAGSLFSISTSVINPHAPPDQHRFKLVTGPEGSWVDPRTGVFYWRPPISEAPNSVRAVIRVEDRGTPPMGSEQELWMNVERPVGPTLELGEQTQGFRFRASADSGSYSVSSSSDGEFWTLLSVTNPPDIRVEFTDTNGWMAQRFYRLVQDSRDPVLEMPPKPGAEGGPYKFAFRTFAGHVWIQASEDLVNWETITETNIGPAVFAVEDPEGQGDPPRTYKVIKGNGDY